MWHVLLLLLCGMLWRCEGQAGEEAIDEFVAAIMEEYNIVGLNLAAVGEAEPYMVRGYGIKNLDTMEEVDENTFFYIASTSKAMTATLLFKLLAEHESFSIDTPVKDILGDEFYLSDLFRERHVNSLDLLAHRVGIPSGDLFISIFQESETREELISRTRFFRATSPLRADHVYSNLMYTIAGRVTEVLTGLSWEDATRLHIFQPLEMTSSTFLHEATEEELDLLALCYMPDEEAGGEMRVLPLEVYAGVGPVAPSGGIISTASDTLQWLLFQSNQGRGPGGEQVMNETDLEATRQGAITLGPQNLDYVKPRTPVSYMEHSYAGGWYAGYYRGFRMFTHTGALTAYYSRATVLPDLGVGLFTSCNSPPGDGLERIHFYVVDTILGHEPWINVTSAIPEHIHASQESHFFAFDNFDDLAFHANSDDRFSGNPQPVPETMRKYEGVYGNFAFGNLTVYFDEELEILKGFYGAIESHLTAHDILPHTFLAKLQDPFWFVEEVPIFFQEDADEEINSLVFPVFLPSDPPVFVRGLERADEPDPIPDHCDNELDLTSQH